MQTAPFSFSLPCTPLHLCRLVTTLAILFFCLHCNYYRLSFHTVLIPNFFDQTFKQVFFCRKKVEFKKTFCYLMKIWCGFRSKKSNNRCGVPVKLQHVRKTYPGKRKLIESSQLREKKLNLSWSSCWYVKCCGDACLQLNVSKTKDRLNTIFYDPLLILPIWASIWCVQHSVVK